MSGSALAPKWTPHINKSAKLLSGASSLLLWGTKMQEVWNKNKSHLLLDRIAVCMGTNRNLFRQTVLQKCVGVSRCSLDYSSWVEYLKIPTSRNPNQNSAALWRIFSSNKSAPANRKPWYEQAEGLDSFCMKHLRTFKSFQIFKSEFIKSKLYSGWCPFQGLSNGTTFMLIQSGRAVPFKYFVA